MTSPVGLWADWSGAGFGSTAYDDLTPYLRSISYQRGGTPEIMGAAQSGSCTIRLLNPGGLFDPDYAAGPLYGFLHDGVRVWFGANEDGSISGAGTVRGRFAGRTLDVAPVPQAGAGTSTPEVEITCEDAKGWYARTPVSLSVASAPEDLIPPLPSPPAGIVGWMPFRLAVGIHSVPLAWTPAAGGTLVILLTTRAGWTSMDIRSNSVAGPSWAALEDHGGSIFQSAIGAAWRVSDGGETSVYVDAGSSQGPSGIIAEIAGVSALSSAADTSLVNTASYTGPSVTPTSGHSAFVLALMEQEGDGASSPTFTPGSGFSLLYTFPWTGYAPNPVPMTRAIASASGSYAPTCTASWANPTQCVVVAASA